MNNRTKRIIGLALLVGYPLVMTFLYGNNELQGKEIYIIPFLTFGIMWGAIALIVLGLRKNNESMKDMVVNRLHLKGKTWEMMSSDRTAGAWIAAFALSIFWWFQASIYWYQVDYWPYMWPWFSISFVLFYLLMIIVVAKVTRSPLHRVVIGASNMKPRDEREQALMAQAGSYAFATLFLFIFLLFLVLISVPRPSSMALLYLLVGLTTVNQGLYKFYCWRLGIRR